MADKLKLYVREGSHHRVYSVDLNDGNQEVQTCNHYYENLPQKNYDVLSWGRRAIRLDEHNRTLFRQAQHVLRRLENEGHQIFIRLYNTREYDGIQFEIGYVQIRYKFVEHELRGLFFDDLSILITTVLSRLPCITVRFRIPHYYYDKFLTIISYLYPSTQFYFIFYSMCCFYLGGRIVIVKCYPCREDHLGTLNSNGFCINHSQHDFNWRHAFNIRRVPCLEDLALTAFYKRFEFEYVYYFRHDGLLKRIRVSKRVVDVPGITCAYSRPFYFGLRERRYSEYVKFFEMIINFWCGKFRIPNDEGDCYYLAKIEGPLLFRPLVWMFTQFPDYFEVIYLDSRRFFLTTKHWYLAPSRNRRCILFEDVERNPIIISNQRPSVKRFREVDLPKHKNLVESYFKNFFSI